ncbi:GNAT family N-acetyltransferase [Georgenia thermotolerans]
MADRVARTPAPGLLAYAGGVPAGWVALAPRGEYPRIPRSTVITYEDVPGCWAITCFYVHPGHRGRGLLQPLLAAAVEHARTHGRPPPGGIPRRAGSRPVRLRAVPRPARPLPASRVRRGGPARRAAHGAADARRHGRLRTASSRRRPGLPAASARRRPGPRHRLSR